MNWLRSTGIAALLSSLLVTGSFSNSLTPRHARAASANDTLVVAFTEEPDTLNALVAQLVASQLVFNMFDDSLLISDAHNNIGPDLATSYSYSPDGLSWTFHLRHGVKWADGVPFTSADVLYTYHAHFDPKNNVFGNQGWDRVDTITAPDDYTVKFHLKQPFAPFAVDVGEAVILPKHIYGKPGFDFNKAAFNRTPFGTGPYMVSEWKTADHITLVPNPYSWRSPGFFKKIIFKIVPNSNTELVQLKTGDIDVGLDIDTALADQAKQIAGKRLDVSPGNNWYHIDLKQWSFLREKVVRQALDYATPKQAIIKGILKGLGTVSTGDIPPVFTQYYNPNVPTHPYNLAKAAALLAADGFTKGPGGILQKNGQPLSIELWTSSDDTTGQKIDTVLKNIWGQIGIGVTLRSQSANTIYGATGPQFTKKMTGVQFSWFNNNDPSDSFYWNSTQIPKSPTGSGGNDVAYFHQFDFQKQIDDLTNAGDRTVDPAKRRAIYFKIQALLADEVPVIFLYDAPNLNVVPTNLIGFQANAFNYPLWNASELRRG